MNNKNKFVVYILVAIIFLIFATIFISYFIYTNKNENTITENNFVELQPEIILTEEEKETINFYNERLVTPTRPLMHFHEFSELNIKSYDEDTFLIMYPYFILDELTGELSNVGQTYIRQVNGNNEILDEFLIEKNFYNTTYYNGDNIYFLDSEHNNITVYNITSNQFHEFNTTLNLLNFNMTQLFFNKNKVYAQAINIETNEACILSLTDNEILNIDIESETIFSYPTYVDGKIYYYERPNIVEIDIENGNKILIPAYREDNGINLYYTNKPIVYDDNIIFASQNNDFYNIENSVFEHYSTIETENHYSHVIPMSYDMIDDETLLIAYEHAISNIFFSVTYNLRTNEIKELNKNYINGKKYYSYIYSDDTYAYMSENEFVDLEDNNASYLMGDKNIIVVHKNTFDLVHTISYQNDNFYSHPKIIRINKN